MTVLTARAIAEIEARDRIIRELREALAQQKMWLGEALDREAVLLSRLGRAEAGASPMAVLHGDAGGRWP